MTCPHLLARLDEAEARLTHVSLATHGHGVEALWRDELARYDPHAVPDAFYINRGDPYITTLIYDVRRDEFIAMGWGDWLESQELKEAAGSAASSSSPEVHRRNWLGSIRRLRTALMCHLHRAGD